MLSGLARYFSRNPSVLPPCQTEGLDTRRPAGPGLGGFVFAISNLCLKGSSNACDASTTDDIT